MTVAPTQPAFAGPVDAPKVVRQRRIRPGLFGLAVLLVALGGLGAAYAITAVRATAAYLAVARPVAVGGQLTEDDLITVQMTGGQGLAPIAASRSQEVIGKYAAVALRPGTLLTAAQLTDEPLLGPDQQQVSIGLKPSQVPAKKLHPGDKVLLVVTAVANASADAAKPAPPVRYEATVVDTATSEKTNTVVVYVALASRDAPAVVTLAVDNRIAVVLTGLG